MLGSWVYNIGIFWIIIGFITRYLSEIELIDNRELDKSFSVGQKH
jgi:hypothetical protein